MSAKKRRGGQPERPETREKAELVCKLIVDETISANKACEKAGIKPGTFYELCERDPEVSEKYARARTTLLHNYAAQIPDIADTPQVGVIRTTKADGSVEEKHADMIEHRRLQIEARKWMLARLMPRVYGDKLALGGAEDLPPVKSESTVTLTPDEAYRRMLGGGS